MEYLDKHREELLKQYPTSAEFRAAGIVNDNYVAAFKAYAAEQGIKEDPPFNFAESLTNFAKANKDTINALVSSANEATTELSSNKAFQTLFEEYLNKQYTKIHDAEAIERTNKYIRYQLEFLLIRNLYNYSDAMKAWSEIDNGYQKAIEVLQNEKLFKKLKIAH